MPGEHVGEGAHTRGQGQIVELLRALPAVPDEVVEQFLMGLQLLLAFDQQVAALGEQRLGGGVQLRAEQVLAQALQGAACRLLLALEAMQRIVQRLGALELHQRFAGQVDQVIEALG